MEVDVWHQTSFEAWTCVASVVRVRADELSADSISPRSVQARDAMSDLAVSAAALYVYAELHRISGGQQHDGLLTLVLFLASSRYWIKKAAAAH